YSKRGFKNLGGNQRITFHGHVQSAVEHGLESARGGIYRDDLDIFSGYETGFFERFDRAKRHFIILPEDALDILGFLQPGFCYLLSFHDAPVASLTFSDLYSALSCCLAETF